jgi:arylsulfatase A
LKEGGIREPAFAYWKGKITPFTRTPEVISSLDVFPTLSALAGIPLPDDRPFDGKDMSKILLDEDGKSQHDFLFFYSTCSGEDYWSVSSVRHGKYKVSIKSLAVLNSVRLADHIVCPRRSLFNDRRTGARLLDLDLTIELN